MISGKSCQEGFGMSFFHAACKDCKCTKNDEWLERKKTMRDAVKQQQSEPADSLVAPRKAKAKSGARRKRSKKGLATNQE